MRLLFLTSYRDKEQARLQKQEQERQKRKQQEEEQKNKEKMRNAFGAAFQHQMDTFRTLGAVPPVPKAEEPVPPIERILNTFRELPNFHMT